MRVETLIVSLFQSNCFIVSRDDEPEAFIIDPGDHAPDILARIDERGLTVKGYLLTHGHVDHVYALAAMVKVHPAPAAMHADDAKWAFTDIAAIPPYYGVPEAPPDIDTTFTDGQTRDIIGFTYKIIHTPGHSPGGVAFYFEQEKILFSGDSLFRGSIGRSDLPGSNPAALAASLQKLMALPDDVTVYCGHGPKTTIGRERRGNPFLKGNISN